MKTYEDEDLLSLSGIQHFAFCERQWALIHIEKQWAENLKTVEGNQMHERADDPFFNETRNNIKTARSVPLMSRKLGFTGVADVIEYHKNSNEIRIVEYKRGKPKANEIDEVQLCAQAMCLEEMKGIELDFGYLFYGETKRRSQVDFDKELRGRVFELSMRMHEIFEKEETPHAIKNSKCKNCSLVDLCLPSLGKKENVANSYLGKFINEIVEELGGN